MNKQDNVPQVKTVEDEAEASLTIMASVPMPATIKPETSANLLTLFKGFKSRIAELERLLSISEYDRKDLVQVQELTLKRNVELEASNAKYRDHLKDFLDLNNKMEAERDKYREALEEITKTDWQSNDGKYFGKSSAQLHCIAKDLAEQALNSKEVD